MLDLSTLALVTMVSTLVFVCGTLTIAGLAPQQANLRKWAIGASLLAVALLLQGMRGTLPDFLSIVLGNVGFVLALGYMHAGTRQLFGLTAGYRWEWPATGLMFVVSLLFTYIQPDLRARVAVVSLGLMFIMAVIGWLFWRHQESKTRTIDRLTALIFASGALMMLARAWLSNKLPASANYQMVTSWSVSAPYLYAILFNVWMPMMLTLKTSTRLRGELGAALERAESSNRALAQALEFNDTIMLNSPVAMGVYAADGQCVLANDAYASLIGASRESLLAQNFRDIVAWQDSGLLADCLGALDEGAPKRREITVESSFGNIVWVDCVIHPVTVQHKRHLLIKFVDLTERKNVEDTLRQFAFHDALTALPNRRLLADRLKQALIRASRENCHIAVLFLDLNHFKALNDQYGHDVGDLLLIEVGKRLRALVRDGDTVARLGGDEFVVLLPGLAAAHKQAAEQAAAVVKKIHDALDTEFVLNSIRYVGSVSIGLKLVRDNLDDVEEVLRDADLDMYEAKRKGRLVELDSEPPRSLLRRNI